APHFGAVAGDGQDADVVVEAAGTLEAWTTAVELVRPGGSVLFFGGLPGGTTISVDATPPHYQELTLPAPFHPPPPPPPAPPRSVRAAPAFLASGAYPWRRLIPHEVGLEGVAPLLADPPRDLLKAAVRP